MVVSYEWKYYLLAACCFGWLLLLQSMQCYVYGQPDCRLYVGMRVADGAQRCLLEGISPFLSSLSSEDLHDRCLNQGGG
jgi:hypothetical protein